MFEEEIMCLQCFDAVGWAAWQPACKKRSGGGTGVVICLGWGENLHMAQQICHCHSLSLAPVNPDWFYLPGFTFLVPAHPGSPGQNPEEP